MTAPRPHRRHMAHRTLARVCKNARGVALIEFAMVLPILVTLYLGGFQLMDAVAVYRKVTTSARILADLSTQNTSLAESDVQTILAASAQVMAPYSTDRGTYRITMVNVDNSGNAKVAWSRSKSGSDQLTINSSYALPATIKQNNIGVVVCDVSYVYHPISFFGLMGDLPFRDQIFMIPRGSTTVELRP